MKIDTIISCGLKMRILFIFLLTTCVVCSEEEGSEEKVSHLDLYTSYETCYYYGKEAFSDNCTTCARKAVTKTEDKGAENEEEMIKIISAKTKEILTECSNYLSDSEKSEQCAKMDGLEFVSCLKTVFPAGVKKRMIWNFCDHSNETDECEQCIFDSLKKSWEIIFKTTVKIETKEEEAEMKKQLKETEVTEMANNCNHLFKNKTQIKECANKEFGKRMDCVEDSMISYRKEEKYISVLCLLTKEESKEEDCDKCVAEFFAEMSNNTQKGKYKKALEKCGEYIERQEEMMECTNKEDEDMSSCLTDIFEKLFYKKQAIWMCKQKSKSDECIECLYQSIQKANEAYQDRTKEDTTTDLPRYIRIGELEATEISTNCYQHFQKEEEIKDCGNNNYGERMDCIRLVLRDESE